MAKRITEHRVRNWAIGGGAGGVVILLLFAFLSSLGSIEVTGYSGDMICAGTENDPCIAIINFTAKEDIFIYPSENWSEAILETDKSVKSVKMFRSWGTSWREIKLNEVCTGTWCGASGDAAYSFAFREGKDYTIKYEVLKNSPYDKIKWSFGPVDPLFDSVADIELISESNSLTYGDAVVKITPKLSFAFEGNKVDTWVNKITPARDMIKYEMSIGENMSYQDEIWVSDIECYPWNETVNETVVEHSGCVDNGYTDYITEYKIGYVPFENQNFQLTEGEPIYLKLHGEWPAQIGEVIYDWKIDLDGYVTTFQWWNATYPFRYPIINNQITAYAISVNDTSGIGGSIIWSLIGNSSYIYSTVSGPSGTIAIANDTENAPEKYWENETSRTGNSPTSVWDAEGVWHFSEGTGTNVYDSTGNSNNGTLVNMEEADWVDGVFGQALNFDPTDEYINVGTMGNFGSNLDNGASISFWINTTDSTTKYIMGSGGTGASGIFNAVFNMNAGGSVDEGKLQIQVKDADGDSLSGGTTNDVVWADGEWHHIVITIDGPNNTVTIYLDGDSLPITYNYQANPDNFPNLPYDLYISGRNWLGSHSGSVDGIFDEFRIYNRILSADEALQQYNNGINNLTILGTKKSLDAIPTVTLNIPVDTANLTITSIIFNCTASDDFNLINVSLYIDGTLNETNSSGINNTDYIFPRTLGPGDYNWTCKGCDNASQCTTATTRTFSIKLNLTGWVTDQDGNFLADVSIIINNQSDNSFVANVTTNGTGFWTYGPVLTGTYIIEGYEPLNVSRHGDSKPHITVP